MAKAVNNPIYPYYVGRAYTGLDTELAGEKARFYFEQALEIQDPYLDVADYL